MAQEVKEQRIEDAVLVKQLRKRVRDLTAILKGKEKHAANMEHRLREYKAKMHKLREENSALKASNETLTKLVNDHIKKV